MIVGRKGTRKRVKKIRLWRRRVIWYHIKTRGSIGGKKPIIDIVMRSCRRAYRKSGELNTGFTGVPSPNSDMGMRSCDTSEE
jgi:hypothetical protein